MDNSGRELPVVVIVLGPEAHAEVIEHTRKVLHHFGIAFLEVVWSDFPELLAGGAPGLQVIIFATGIAYTDEHLRLPDDLFVPVFRVVTDAAPPPDQLLKGTPLTAFAGFGVNGAVNAGQLAARILANNDATLRDLLKTKPYQGS